MEAEDRRPTSSAIDRLGGLRQGWDSYDADPVHPFAQKLALECALAVVQLLSTPYDRPVVGATADGGVTLAWRKPGEGEVVAFFSPSARKHYLLLDARRMPVGKGEFSDYGVFARDILKGHLRS